MKYLIPLINWIQRLHPLEHSCTFHCNQAHYVTVPGGGTEAGFKGGQAVVGSGRLGLVRDSGGGLGGGIDGGV